MYVYYVEEEGREGKKGGTGGEDIGKEKRKEVRRSIHKEKHFSSRENRASESIPNTFQRVEITIGYIFGLNTLS